MELMKKVSAETRMAGLVVNTKLARDSNNKV